MQFVSNIRNLLKSNIKVKKTFVFVFFFQFYPSSPWTHLRHQKYFKGHLIANIVFVFLQFYFKWQIDKSHIWKKKIIWELRILLTFFLSGKLLLNRSILYYRIFLLHGVLLHMNLFFFRCSYKTRVRPLIMMCRFSDGWESFMYHRKTRNLVD